LCLYLSRDPEPGARDGIEYGEIRRAYNFFLPLKSPLHVVFYPQKSLQVDVAFELRFHGVNGNPPCCGGGSSVNELVLCHAHRLRTLVPPAPHALALDSR
jgi:hypothetical protein